MLTRILFKCIHDQIDPVLAYMSCLERRSAFYVRMAFSISQPIKKQRAESECATADLNNESDYRLKMQSV